MRSTLLILLIIAMLSFWLPVSSKDPLTAQTRAWPPDLTNLLERPYGPGWSPEVRYVEPAGQLGGSTQFVFVQDNLAYVAGGFSGLHILDAHDPDQPVEIGRYPVPEDCVDVAVVANTAFVAVRYGGLLVLDVSDPAMPRRLGYRALPGDPRRVAVVGNTTFLTAETGGLRIVDVTNPADPIEVGSYPVPGMARAVAVQGAMAYVAAGPAGLVVIDVSDPRHPRLVGAMDTPGDAWDVAIGYWLTQAPSLPEGWQMWLCWDATCDSSPSPPRRVVAPGAKENIGLRFLLPPDLQNAQLGTVRITGSCDHCAGTVYDQVFRVFYVPPAPEP